MSKQEKTQPSAAVLAYLFGDAPIETLVGPGPAPRDARPEHRATPGFQQFKCRECGHQYESGWSQRWRRVETLYCHGCGDATKQDVWTARASRRACEWQPAR